MYIPAAATPKDMCRFHSLDYIDFLQKVTPHNADEYSKFFQQYNVMEDWYFVVLWNDLLKRIYSYKIKFLVLFSMVFLSFVPNTLAEAWERHRC